MDPASLLHSAQSEPSPPRGINDELRALWLARADRWDEAHDRCQDLPNPAGAWIHAYLHRVEGDLGNAAYWYTQAGQPTPKAEYSLEEEWSALVAYFST